MRRTIPEKMNRAIPHEIVMAIDELIDWYCQDETITRLVGRLGRTKVAQEIDELANRQKIAYGRYYELVEAIDWYVANSIHQDETK